jgi:hypothetical protein
LYLNDFILRYKNKHFTGQTMESTVGEHGGNISKNMLEINITPEDHGAIIICEAINDELQESTHNAQTLSVKCKIFFR